MTARVFIPEIGWALGVAHTRAADGTPVILVELDGETHPALAIACWMLETDAAFCRLAPQWGRA